MQIFYHESSILENLHKSITLDNKTGFYTINGREKNHLGRSGDRKKRSPEAFKKEKNQIKETVRKHCFQNAKAAG